jgi:hypothetical protein
MKYTIRKCTQGFDVCCQTCEAKEVCHDRCDIVRPCMFQTTTENLESHFKELQIRNQKKIKRMEKIVIVILLVVMAALGYLAQQLSDMEIMQTDTLNTLMQTERQIDDLSESNTQAEQDYQSTDKNATRGSERLVQLSQSEREYIERVCMAESNLLDGMFAVANVIYNRSVLWHKSPMEVVQQTNQFAAPSQNEISPEAAQAVWAVFEENMKAFETSNPTHFYAEGTAEPYWTDNKTYIESRGGNRFYESNY